MRLASGAAAFARGATVAAADAVAQAVPHRRRERGDEENEDNPMRKVHGFSSRGNPETRNPKPEIRNSEFPPSYGAFFGIGRTTSHTTAATIAKATAVQKPKWPVMKSAPIW